MGFWYFWSQSGSFKSRFTCFYHTSSSCCKCRGSISHLPDFRMGADALPDPAMAMLYKNKPPTSPVLRGKYASSNANARCCEWSITENVERSNFSLCLFLLVFIKFLLSGTPSSKYHFFQLFPPYHTQHNKEGKQNKFPEDVDSPKWPYVLYLFHVNYIPLVFSQVTHKRHATDTGMGMGQAGKRRKRKGKEWWMKVSLSLVKAGDSVLCNGLSRSWFCPLDFISGWASLWWSGTCDPKLVLEGGWRGWERTRNPKVC